MGSDITRLTFDHRKQYVGVVKQQGRVTLDADDNEALDIALESNRRDKLDIIGPCGTPDDGFSITNPREENGSVNFYISAGTMYVGGIRYTFEKAYTYLDQPDWRRNNPQEGGLPFPSSGAVGGLPVPSSGVVRNDLVYLMLWQQDVSASEDAELLEVALGGIDTTARRKTFGRVLVFPAGFLKRDCAGAWKALGEHWSEERFGTLMPTGELTTDVRLTVDFDPTSNSPDLCSPVTQGGYLEAANQAIRVQIVDRNNLLWGFDNASALYRVRLRADRTTVEFDMVPLDEFHHPRPGQAVEVLLWSAELSNGEKLAALMGHITTVNAPYNPNNRTLSLADPYPDEWGVFDDSGNALTLYLRVWQEHLRFDDTESAPVKLGMTGVQVTLTGTQFRPGDYWTIGVRPATPQTVHPKRLLTGKAPDGIRYFACPLALIRWGGDQPFVSDCRKHFDNLVELSRRVSSGRVIFQDMHGQDEIRQSEPIKHGLQEKHIAIILSMEFGSKGNIEDTNAFRVMGDTGYFPVSPEHHTPLMWAVHTNAMPDEFVIILQDRRPRAQEPLPGVSFIVRWWAIPKDIEQDDTNVGPSRKLQFPPDDFIVGFIAMYPNIKFDILAGEFGIQDEQIKNAFYKQLIKLVDGGRIKRDGSDQDSTFYIPFPPFVIPL